MIEAILNLFNFVFDQAFYLAKIICSYWLRDHPRHRFGLYGQVTKRARWMPRQSEAMKDVVACDKARGSGKQLLIRAFPNGETHPS